MPPTYNIIFATLMSRLSDVMNRLGEPMRAKAYKTAEESILSMREEIHSIKDLEKQPGIGPTIRSKLQEYLDTGKINILEREENRPEIVLSNVYGIGPKKAKELVIQGITTIELLRQNQHQLNSVQKTGLQYYEDIQKRIPREEIALYDKYLSSLMKRLNHTPSNKNYDENAEIKYEIVGSYRRNQSSSGDIDVILTSSDPQNYDRILDILIERNIIVEVLSRGKHKCLVIAKIPESSVYRRVDFLFAPPEQYAFSLLYFTGSKGFNVVMRKHSLQKGFSLNEHGFTPQPREPCYFPSERSIFDFLGLRYMVPEDRSDGRAVIPADLSPPFKTPPKGATDMNRVRHPPHETACSPLQNCKERKNVSDKKTRKKREPRLSGRKSKRNNMDHLSQETNIKQSSPIIKDMKRIEEFKRQGITLLEKLSESQLNEMVEQANLAYFNENPILSDNEYDIIKEYIAKKFPKADVLAKIGAPISGKNKVKLPYEMPSMDKIKPDSGALESWKTKFTGPYVLSCKLDGVSGLYMCDQKGVYKLYTRGDGSVGQDISHLIPILNLPNIPRGMAVRGEFILKKSVFHEKYAGEFANARNLVSGIINRKSLDEKAKDLQFVTYEVIEPLIKPSEQFKLLRSEQLEVVMNQNEATITNQSLSDILLDWRKNYEYEIDGVIVTNDYIHPRVSGNPEYAFAFKMVLSEQIAEAKVVDVEWEASKNGYLKPRVRIEPIRLGGVSIEYATGFNGKFIEDNKIGIGAVIMMVRSGDVIPYIKSVTTPAEQPKMPLIPYIWNKTHVDILLENPEEDVGVQEKNVTLFFTTLEVDGLAKGTVHKLFKAGKTSVADILQMTETDFRQIEGFQEKTAKKLFHGIRDKVASASLLDIMVASGKLGRGLGHRKIAPILEAYPDVLTSTSSPQEKETRLKTIAGIGPENAREFVKNIPSFLEFLRTCNIESKLIPSKKDVIKEIAETARGPLSGKKIVMTKVRDPDIISFMTNQGGFLENTMKKDILALIVKTKDDKSNKTEYAEKNGIPIMTVEEFKQKYMLVA